MKNFLQKPVPIWIALVLVSITVFSLLTTAYQSNELAALRNEIRRAEEAKFPASFQSTLNNYELCRRNWVMKFKSWYTGTDACE